MMKVDRDGATGNVELASDLHPRRGRPRCCRAIQQFRAAHIRSGSFSTLSPIARGCALPQLPETGHEFKISAASPSSSRILPQP